MRLGLLGKIDLDGYALHDIYNIDWHVSYPHIQLSWHFTSPQVDPGSSSLSKSVLFGFSTWTENSMHKPKP